MTQSEALRQLRRNNLEWVQGLGVKFAVGKGFSESATSCLGNIIKIAFSMGEGHGREEIWEKVRQMRCENPQ